MQTTQKVNTTTFKKKFLKHWQLYVLSALPLLFYIVFRYGPMYGILLAFKRYNVTKGIWGSPFVGFLQFKRFFSNPSSWQIIWNTFSLSMYQLLLSLPFAVILALALNEAKSQLWKKSVQMITYAPYFISTVVLVAILMQFLDPSFGMFNFILAKFGKSSINFIGEPQYYKNIFVWSGIWQGTGYNAIIYIAALSGIDPDLYEASRVDGVNKWQKIWNIDLPSIRSTIVILLILNMGHVMSLGFEKAYLLQNSLNQQTSEIMSTYVYKMGILNSDFSYSTAIDLINSVVNICLILFFNKLAKKVDEDGGLW